MTRPHRLCQLSNPARVLRPLVLLRDPTLASPHRSRAPSHRLRIPRPRDLRSNQRHAHVVHLVRVVPRRLRKPLAQFRPHASHRQHSRRRGFERHRPRRPTRSILLPRLETPRSRRTARETSSPRSTTKTTRAPPSTVLATRASTPSLRTRSRAPPPRRSPSSSSSSPRARVSAAVESRRVAVSNRARQTLNPTTATVLCTSYARTHTGMRVSHYGRDTREETRETTRETTKRRGAGVGDARAIDRREADSRGSRRDRASVRAADSRAFGFVWVRSRRVVERDSRENCERCAGRDDGDGAFAVV